jgi:hypothetical protein
MFRKYISPPCSSETSTDFQRLYGIISLKMEVSRLRSFQFYKAGNFLCTWVNVNFRRTFCAMQLVQFKTLLSLSLVLTCLNFKDPYIYIYIYIYTHISLVVYFIPWVSLRTLRKVFTHFRLLIAKKKKKLAGLFTAYNTSQLICTHVSRVPQSV